MFAAGTPYRPLGITIRDDLQFVEHAYRGEKYWVVGDALAIEYYRFNEQEFALLSWLDGKRSLDDLKELFEATFSPYQVSHREIESYLIDFHKKGLVATFAPDQGRHLRKMSRRKRLKKGWNNAKSLLAFRWRGVNPDRVFRAVTPLFGWLFSTWMVVLGLLVMLFALTWFGVHFDEARARLPAASQFFSGENWASLVMVMIGMKIIHEFAHGIVFTRFGGRCHELGVMLLVFMPTLYVNTSDSWRFPSKWKRAGVAAAGMYIEMLAAAIAMFVWWQAKPGPLQFVCLNIMALGAISSVLFNGNPLLKFDGYYLLSDLIEIPNLQQRSGRYVRDCFLYYGLGIREGDDERYSSRGTKAWLLGYALAAYAFRIFLVYAIAFLVLRFFRPVGLEELAKMFSFLIMSMLIVVPLLALIKYFWVPGRWDRVETRRAAVTGAVLVGVLLLVFAVPFPHSISCNFVVEPGDAMAVYVPHEAVLKEVYVKPRQNVSAGQPVAMLRNLELEMEIAEYEGRLAELDREAEILQRTRFVSARNVPRSVEIREERRTIEKQLAKRRDIMSSLLLLAPRSGMVMPVRHNPLPKDDPKDLDSWEGWTLDPENINASFERGQPFFRVGDFENPVARLLIDQSDVRLIEPEQRVRLMFESAPHDVVESTVDAIAEANAELVQASVTHQHGGKIEAKAPDERTSTSANYIKPAGATYEAMVRLNPSEILLPAGLRGEARVYVGQATIANRIYRFLNKTFRFDL